MSILIICQKLAEDDDLLGAFVAWVRSISKRADRVFVICLAKGEYHLPENCQVYSLGKERGVGRIRRWFNFFGLMFKLAPKCEATFSHMSPIFSIASWPFVKLFRKKATLWYAHGAVTWKIKLAEKCVDIIFTSTSEGCRIKSKKIKVVGQGIDVEKFKPLWQDTRYKIQDTNKFQSSKSKLFQINNKCQMTNDEFQMVSIGRIAPSKDYETMILAAEELVKRGVSDFEIKVIGKPGIGADEKYFEKIKEIVKDKNLKEQIKFIGAIPNKETVKYYQEAKIYLNMSQTGSLDRAIVEAMACGCIVLTCNEAAAASLKNADLSWLMYDKKDYMGLANKILEIKKLETEKLMEIGLKLRREVVENHSVERLGEKVVEVLKNLSGE